MGIPAPPAGGRFFFLDDHNLEERMGRYTSVQVFSDHNTKLVSAGAGYAASSSSSGGGGGGGAAQPKAARPEKAEVFVASSNAGAGSEQFHIYRAARRRELDRLDNIEKEANEMEAARIYEEKIARNKFEAEERTRKNAEKRKRKKSKKIMKIKEAKANGGGTTVLSANEEEEEEEDEEIDEHEAILNAGKKQRV